MSERALAKAVVGFAVLILGVALPLGGLLAVGPARVASASTVPGALREVTAVGGIGQVKVSWLAPLSDGNSPITAYNVTTSASGRICSTTGPLSCVVSDLVNGNAYTFTVSATNANGTGPGSVPSPWATPAPAVVFPGWTGVATGIARGATAVSEGADGTVWITGTATVAGGHPVYRLSGASLIPEIPPPGFPTGAVAIAVGPTAGLAWGMDSMHEIWQWTPAPVPRPGLPTAISEGADGVVWATGPTTVYGGHPIYRWNGCCGWILESGGATAIAVGPNGLPWVVNSFQQVFQWTGTTWAARSGAGAATAISEGADGAVWIIGPATVYGGHPIYLWNGASWTREPGAATALAVGPNGLPWAVNSFNQLFKS
jgi:hypothetical protein